MALRRGRAVASPGAEKCGEPVKVPRGIAQGAARAASVACSHQQPCAGAGASKASLSASLKRQRAFEDQHDAASPHSANDECKHSVDEKKRERKRRNRESAALSRMRAKKRVAQLEETTVALREQNSELRRRVDSLSYMQQDLQATVAQLHMSALQYHPQQTVDRALRQAGRATGSTAAARAGTAAAATGVARGTTSHLLQAGPGLQAQQLHNHFTARPGEAASALYAGRPLPSAMDALDGIAPAPMLQHGMGGVATLGSGDDAASGGRSLLSGGTAVEPQDQVGEGDVLGFGLHGDYDVGGTGDELQGGVTALDPDIASILAWDELDVDGKK